MSAQTEREKRKKAFGAWLKAKREQAELTQQQMAERLGSSQVHLSRIENGESGTSRTMIEKLIKLLRLKGEEAREPYLIAGFTPPSGDTQSKAARDLKLVESLPPQIQRAHSVMVRALFAEFGTKGKSGNGEKDSGEGKPPRRPKQVQEPPGGLNVPVTEEPPAEENNEQHNGDGKRVAR